MKGFKLVKISITNFSKFNKEQTLFMLADSDYKTSLENIIKTNDNVCNRLLKIACIYTNNAYRASSPVNSWFLALESLFAKCKFSYENDNKSLPDDYWTFKENKSPITLKMDFFLDNKYFSYENSYKENKVLKNDFVEIDKEGKERAVVDKDEKNNLFKAIIDNLYFFDSYIIENQIMEPSKNKKQEEFSNQFFKAVFARNYEEIDFNLHCLMGTFYKVFKNGGVLFIDNADTHFHPDVLAFIIKCFQDKKLNKANGQLILSLQDDFLLEKFYDKRTEDCEQLLRKDQIYFESKDRNEALHLHSACEYSNLPAAESLATLYRQGFFGSRPPFMPDKHDEEYKKLVEIIK